MESSTQLVHRGRLPNQPIAPLSLIDIALCCFVLSAAASLLLSHRPVVKGWGLAVAFGAVSFLIVRFEERRWGRGGRTSPMSLYAAFWFLYFGILGIASFYYSSEAARLGVSHHALVKSLAVALGSLLLIGSGYLITTRSHPKEWAGTPTLKSADRYVNFAAVATCFLVGWVARIVGYRRGNFSYLGILREDHTLIDTILGFGEGLIRVGIAVSAFVFWGPHSNPQLRRKVAILLLINSPLLLAFGMASGYKAQLVTDLLPLGIGYLLLRQRIPWKTLLVLFIYLALVLPGIEGFRKENQPGSRAAQEDVGVLPISSEVLANIGESTSSNSIADLAGGLATHFSTEYVQINRNLAIILERTPNPIPFLGTRRLLVAPLFFLPASTVSDLPVNIGKQFNVVYLRGSPESSSPTTQPGDLYMSGGWPVLILGELAIGMLLGLLWRKLAMHGSGSRLTLYILIAPLFVNAGLDFGNLGRLVAQSIVLYGALLAFVVMPKSKARSVSRATNTKLAIG